MRRWSRLRACVLACTVYRGKCAVRQARPGREAARVGSPASRPPFRTWRHLLLKSTLVPKEASRCGARLLQNSYCQVYDGNYDRYLLKTTVSKSAIMVGDDKDPAVRRRELSGTHITITSTRSFAATHDALSGTLPYYDKGALPARLKAAASPDDKREILATLPALAILALPQDMGGLAAILGGQGGKVTQYEIGNPFIAGQLAKLNLSAALYTPVRVILREMPDGKAVLEYDSPGRSIGQFGDAGMDAIAAELDNALQKALCEAAGLVTNAGSDGNANAAGSMRL
jgi:hypothetical protein